MRSVSAHRSQRPYLELGIQWEDEGLMSESTKMVVEVFVDAMIGDVEEAPALACLVQRREGGGQHWLRDVQHRELQRSLLRHRHHPEKKGSQSRERKRDREQTGGKPWFDNHVCVQFISHSGCQS